MNARVDSSTTRRLRNLARCGLVWGFCIFARLFYLQVVAHDDLKKAALKQQEETVEIPAPRGIIRDRNRRPLAMSTLVDSVAVSPVKIPDLQVAAGILSRILNIDEIGLLDKMRTYKGSNKGFLWVKRKVSADEAERIRNLKFEWVELRKENHREYPKGSLAAHVIGSVDHEEKGNGGVELGLQEELEGIPGQQRRLRDVRQREFASRVVTKPQPGKDVTLTIDERIQYVAEEKLAEAVVGAHCKTGSMVILDARNGDILAMASYPTFDPNEPPANGMASRLNLAVSAPFEPGSVFKVITLSSALETTRLGPESSINCHGGTLTLFGRVIHEAKHGYGYLSMADVLAKSSNIGAIEIGRVIGNDRFYEYIKKFGFGQTTGIPLPAESAGVVRPLRKWSAVSIGSVAMGHEVLTTTLQLAQAGLVVANGGFLVKPRLVLEKQRPGGEVEREAAKEPVPVLKPKTAITMRQMMERVIMPGGTGYPVAKLSGYTAGGKTGSAQIYDNHTHTYTHKYNASFMGLAPLNNPAIVVVVTLNGSSQFGGVVAAPVFKEVASAALRILEVPKDLPEKPAGELQLASNEKVDKDAANDVAIASLSEPDETEIEAVPVVGPAVPDGAVYQKAVMEKQGLVVPDFVGKTMRAVLVQSSASGVPVDVVGRGIAKAQRPPAGSILPRGESVRVVFAR